MVRPNTPDDVLGRIEVNGDCWLWTGTITHKGYGRCSYGNRKWPAHRLVHELLVGPCPEGLVSDHLCRIRHCVCPDHIEFVTNAENVMRGASRTNLGMRNLSKTHCPHGHEYTPENTYRAPGYPNRRECIACIRRRTRAQTQARRSR